YQVSPTPITNLTTGIWTDFSGLNFNAIVTGGIAGALDGNLPANQRRVSASLPVTLPANSYIMLRWTDADDQGADHGLALDDLLVSRNFPPQAAADAYSTAEDTPLTVAAPGVLANDTDPESGPLTAVLASQAAHGAVVLNAAGSFTYTPDANWHGTDSFTYTASDGNFSSAAATVTLTVSAVNDAPNAWADAYPVQEDQTLTQAEPGILGNDSDPDGDGITADLVSGPAHGTLTLNADSSFTYVPDANWNGTDSFAYRAFDGGLYSSAATVTLTVSPVNDAPTGQADAYSTDEDLPLQVAPPGVLGNDSDLENDPLTAAVASDPAHGTLTLSADGSFT
ncbi:tandem-95 repeat protein, partial [bacterium]